MCWYKKAYGTTHKLFVEIVKFKSLTKTYTLLVYHEFHFFQYQSERSDRFMSKIYIDEDGSFSMRQKEAAMLHPFHSGEKLKEAFK